MSDLTKNLVKTILEVLPKRMKAQNCTCHQCSDCQIDWALETAVGELLRLQEKDEAWEVNSIPNRLRHFAYAVHRNPEWYDYFKDVIFGKHGPHDDSLRDTMDRLINECGGDEVMKKSMTEESLEDIIEEMEAAHTKADIDAMLHKTMTEGVQVGCGVVSGAPVDPALLQRNYLLECELAAQPFKFKKEHEQAVLPEYAHPGDAGMDVRTVEEVHIGEGKRMLVRTGLSCQIPDGWELQVRPRGGMTMKEGLMVMNSPGTVDAGFRGEIKVILFRPKSMSDMVPDLARNEYNEIVIPAGTKIAQLVPSRVNRVRPEWTEDEHDETSRGGGMLSSTGVQ